QGWVYGVSATPTPQAAPALVAPLYNRFYKKATQTAWLFYQSILKTLFALAVASTFLDSHIGERQIQLAAGDEGEGLQYLCQELVRCLLYAKVSAGLREAVKVNRNCFPALA